MRENPSRNKLILLHPWPRVNVLPSVFWDLTWRLYSAAPCCKRLTFHLCIFCLKNSLLQSGPGHLLRPALCRARTDLRPERWDGTTTLWYRCLEIWFWLGLCVSREPLGRKTGEEVLISPPHLIPQTFAVYGQYGFSEIVFQHTMQLRQEPCS